MGNISVYHSLWKGGLTVAIQFGFAALGVYAFTHTHGFHRILAWLWTLTFTIAGILRLWLFLKERITRTPYYLIIETTCFHFFFGFLLNLYTTCKRP